MKVAALYDIHGNLPALEAVLEAVRRAGVDEVVVGGDVVLGPMPRECLALLLDLDLPVRFIQGNTDREVLEQRAGRESPWFRSAAEAMKEPIRWTARQLEPDDARQMSAWPATCHLEVSGIGRVLFCHATPRNDTEIMTRLTDEQRLVPVFAGVDDPVVVCGHTHMPFDRMVGATRVVNAGSVGMPFGKPGAYWLLLGPGVALRHTPYDLEVAAARIRAMDYPHADAFAARYVVEPPSEEKMLEAFGNAELADG